MPHTLIVQKPDFAKKVEGEDKLAIAELFCDTIQGEGINTGVPATFLRLQGCTLQCTWCDTLDVWPHGNEYSFEEIFKLLESREGLIDQLISWNQHLVITGGSPLKQQQRIVNFVHAFIDRYHVLPYIEVENETVLVPSEELKDIVYCWNNSPKLQNSGMKKMARYKHEAIQAVAKLSNSWFKFVISKPEDWREIADDFILPSYIKKNQIILMPEGDTQEKLNANRAWVADLAVAVGVRFSDRLHVTIWNKKTGV